MTRFLFLCSNRASFLSPRHNFGGHPAYHPHPRTSGWQHRSDSYRDQYFDDDTSAHGILCPTQGTEHQPDDDH